MTTVTEYVYIKPVHLPTGLSPYRTNVTGRSQSFIDREIKVHRERLEHPDDWAFEIVREPARTDDSDE